MRYLLRPFIRWLLIEHPVVWVGLILAVVLAIMVLGDPAPMKFVPVTTTTK